MSCKQGCFQPCRPRAAWVDVADPATMRLGRMTLPAKVDEAHHSAPVS